MMKWMKCNERVSRAGNLDLALPPQHNIQLIIFSLYHENDRPLLFFGSSSPAVSFCSVAMLPVAGSGAVTKIGLSRFSQFIQFSPFSLLSVIFLFSTISHEVFPHQVEERMAPESNGLLSWPNLLRVRNSWETIQIPERLITREGWKNHTFSGSSVIFIEPKMINSFCFSLSTF